MMDRSELLQKLPPVLNRYKPIKKDQSVYDIVREVMAAHQIFAPDYDRIAADFDNGSNTDVAKSLFNFLKKNVRYEVETDRDQTTKSPSVLLTQGFGDCKHYSGFIAGVLDALKRKGRKINFAYRFASYNFLNKTPGHVFVVMWDKGEEIWIDPVLKTFNERLQPAFILDKKPKQMLQRLSGVYDVMTDTFLLDEADRELSPELIQAIALLYNYKILNAEGKVNDAMLTYLSTNISPEDFEKVAQARVLIHQQAIGGLFDNIFRGIKKVSMAVPRNAFLSLVALNGLGLATKLHYIMTNKDGSIDYANEKKIYNKWNFFGGDWGKLKAAINSGRKKKPVLGGKSVGEPVTITAILAAATPIVIAITAVIKEALTSKRGAGTLDPSIDPLTGLPYAGGSGNGGYDSGSGNIMDFIQNNPLLVAGAAAGAYYFLTRKKKTA